MLKDLDIVVLTRDLPAEGLVSGTIGTIVAAYQDGATFEVGKTGEENCSGRA